MNKAALKRHCFLIVAIALAILAALPLLSESGLLNTRGGGDSPFLLQRLHQLTTVLADGHFPVRWMPDANYGYGYPFYNFYAPLSIYITAVFRIIGFSFTRSIQLSQLTGFIIAAWGMYALGRRWFGSKWAAFLTAAAYTTAPFHLVNIYVRGDSLAEFWAMAFYPLVILAVDGVMDAGDNQRKSRIALLALAYAALILSHNISALIFSPFLLLYILLRLHFSPSPSLPRSPAPLLALLLAFALAAWFFVPAMVEKTAVQLGTVTEGYFHFSNHFHTTDLVQTSFFFDYNPDGGIAFRMGLVQFLAVIAGSVALLWNSRLSGYRMSKAEAAMESVEATATTSTSSASANLWGRTTFILLTLAISTFMILPLSTLLWEHLPLLSFTQFPWRFLSVQAFAGAMAVGALGLLPRPRFIVPALTFLLFLAAFGTLQTDHLTITDADVTAVKLAQYEWFTGNIGSTVSAEYLPLGVQPRPYTSAWLNSGDRDAAIVLSGDAKIRIASREATGQVWEITTNSSELDVSNSIIQFPTLNWLGWKATIDGEPVPIAPAPNGLITLDVPAGAHEIGLRLHRTPIQLAAELFSLLALLLAGWMLWPRRTPVWAQYTIPAIAVLVGLMAVLRLWPPSPITANDLTWDFAQMGYLHHDVDGTPFNNGVTLGMYEYVMMENGRFSVILDWENVPSERAMVTLSLSTPATAWPAFTPSAPSLLSQSQPMAGQMIFRFDTPADVPISPYIPRLQVENASALTPSGQKRGDLYLRPLTLDESAMMGSEKRPLSIKTTAVTQTPNSITVNLAWFTSQPLAINYNTSLRLVDANGQDVSQWDGQPGYGFQPSSLWQAGVWMPDQLAMPSPQQPSRPPYALVARLYDVTKTGDVLIRRLGELDGEGTFTPQEPSFTLPDGIDSLYEGVIFYEAGEPLIQLRGSDVERRGDGQLVVRLYWEMLAETACTEAECAVSYTRFVHLSPDGQPLIAQNDGLPVHNSYPTSQWKIGEIVVDEVVLQGEMGDGYTITTGFYLNLGDQWPRLPLDNGDSFVIYGDDE